MKTKISIIIPTFNRRNELEKCIRSINKLDYPKDKYEIIIVDNNSTDSTKEFLESIKSKNIKIGYEKKQSSYASRNKGVEISKFDILLFTDSDCILPKKTLKIIDLYIKNGMYAGKMNIKVHKPNSQLLKFQQEFYDKNRNNKEYCFFETNSFIIKKSKFKLIGDFDSKFFSSGDIDYSIRTNKKGVPVTFMTDAIIYHKSKRDLISFIKANYFTGRGKIRLFNKYKSKWIYQELISPIHVISIARDLIKSIPDIFISHSKRFFPLYFAIGNIAYRFGILIELLKNSKFAKAFK